MINLDSKFSLFLEKFPVDSKKKMSNYYDCKLPSIRNKHEGYSDFISSYGGRTFGDQIYKIHLSQNIQKWSLIVRTIFPEHANELVCFAYDWLGRQFCIASNHKISQEAFIYRFDVSTNESMIVSDSFMNFHNVELTSYPEEILSTDMFNQWMLQNERNTSVGKCTGFIHPPFLGGKIELDNLEEIDLEIYWNILGQILLKAKKMPRNSKISKIQIQELN